MDKPMKALYEQTKAFGAGQGHIKMRQIFKDSQATAVVSVYIDENPSNEVLDELVSWAEDNGNQVLLDKIEELATLKS